MGLHTLRVYYEDTDAGGVVVLRELSQILRARPHRMAAALGVSQHVLLTEQHIGFVVRSVQADYLASARLDDELEVRTRIESLRRASIVFHQSVMRGDTLLFTARVLVACIDMLRHKPAAIPQSLHLSIENHA